jgi:hypothetical protein
MPDCILRVSTPRAKLKACLSGLATMKPCSIFVKGQPVTPASSRLARHSGFNALVSRADGDLPAQCLDATRFLRVHAEDLTLLHRSLGAGHMRLDFGLWDTSSEDRPWPTFFLPHTLVSAAGTFGITLELSFYGPPGGE